MFNIGGGEFVVILLVALLVLGPARLPQAARQVGKFASEVRRISSMFQSEIENAMDFGAEEDARAEGEKLTTPSSSAAPEAAEETPEPTVGSNGSDEGETTTDEEPVERDPWESPPMHPRLMPDAASTPPPPSARTPRLGASDQVSAAADEDPVGEQDPDHESGTEDPTVSTAAAAGMFDVTSAPERKGDDDPMPDPADASGDAGDADARSGDAA